MYVISFLSKTPFIHQEYVNDKNWFCWYGVIADWKVVTFEKKKRLIN